ncbi:MAG: hypothetical protein WCY11_04365, partial [Novosphingobium sp.]
MAFIFDPLRGSDWAWLGKVAAFAGPFLFGSWLIPEAMRRRLHQSLHQHLIPARLNDAGILKKHNDVVG